MRESSFYTAGNAHEMSAMWPCCDTNRWGRLASTMRCVQTVRVCASLWRRAILMQPSGWPTLSAPKPCRQVPCWAQVLHACHDAHVLYAGVACPVLGSAMWAGPTLRLAHCMRRMSACSVHAGQTEVHRAAAAQHCRGPQGGTGCAQARLSKGPCDGSFAICMAPAGLSSIMRTSKHAKGMASSACMNLP